MNDTKPEKDWQEDWHHENGQYYCRCVHCKEQFIGYKRRVVCKECSTNLEKASTMMSDKGYEEGSLDNPTFKETQARHHALWKTNRMNEELIQRLVDQCIVKRERHGTTVDVLQSRPFAELIVRECIKVCEQVISDPVPKSADIS